MTEQQSTTADRLTRKGWTVTHRQTVDGFVLLARGTSVLAVTRQGYILNVYRN